VTKPLGSYVSNSIKVHRFSESSYEAHILHLRNQMINLFLESNEADTQEVFGDDTI